MIETPARFADVPFYRADGLSLLFRFEDESGQPADVSDAVFTCRLFNQADADLATPTLDVSDAANGRVLVSFTPDITATLPVYSRLSLYESARWNRTVLLGRAVANGHLAASRQGPVQIDDEGQLAVVVTVTDIAIKRTTVWDSLGTMTWDNANSTWGSNDWDGLGAMMWDSSESDTWENV